MLNSRQHSRARNGFSTALPGSCKGVLSPAAQPVATHGGRGLPWHRPAAAAVLWQGVSWAAAAVLFGRQSRRATLRPLLVQHACVCACMHVVPVCRLCAACPAHCSLRETCMHIRKAPCAAVVPAACTLSSRCRRLQVRNMHALACALHMRAHVCAGGLLVAAAAAQQLSQAVVTGLVAIVARQSMLCNATAQHAHPQPGR
jgi:hypothetical protein